MKILILSDDFPPHASGGAGGVAFNIARWMIQNGHSVSVITSVRKVEDEGEKDYFGIKIYSFQLNYHERWRAYLSLFNFKASSFVKRIIEKERPDIVHAHNIHQYISYNSLRIAKNSGARVVLTAHDCMLFHYGKFTDFIDQNDLSIKDSYDYHVSPLSQLKTFRFRYNPFRNILTKWFLKNVDSICAVSFELKKALEVNGIDNVKVIHNAIDTSLWKSDPKTTSDFINKNSLQNSNKVLFAGKLTKAKGGEELIKALASLKNTALIIVGQKDEYTSNLVYQAKSNGIKVVTTGWVNEKELIQIYSATDIVAFPSICFDTFGLVNLEGMISKKPVIATCFGGAKEIVINNETGFIINPFDIENFSRKIKELFDDKELSRRMGENGYKRVIENFDISKQVGEYEGIYGVK